MIDEWDMYDSSKDPSSPFFKVDSTSTSNDDTPIDLTNLDQLNFTMTSDNDTEGEQKKEREITEDDNLTGYGEHPLPEILIPRRKGSKLRATESSLSSEVEEDHQNTASVRSDVDRFRMIEEAESESPKASVVSNLESDFTTTGTSAKYESKFMPKVVQMLDHGCAWIEGYDCGLGQSHFFGNDFQQSTLFSKDQKILEAQPFHKSSLLSGLRGIAESHLMVSQNEHENGISHAKNDNDTQTEGSVLDKPEAPSTKEKEPQVESTRSTSVNGNSLKEGKNVRGEVTGNSQDHVEVMEIKGAVSNGGEKAKPKVGDELPSPKPVIPLKHVCDSSSTAQGGLSSANEVDPNDHPPLSSKLGPHRIPPESCDEDVNSEKRRTSRDPPMLPRRSPIDESPSGKYNVLSDGALHAPNPHVDTEGVSEKRYVVLSNVR